AYAVVSQEDSLPFPRHDTARGHTSYAVQKRLNAIRCRQPAVADKHLDAAGRENEKPSVIGDDPGYLFVGLRVVKRGPRFVVSKLAPVQRSRRVRVARNKKAIPVNRQKPSFRRILQRLHLPAIPHQKVVDAIAEEGDVLPSPRYGPHWRVLQVGRNFRERAV